MAEKQISNLAMLEWALCQQRLDPDDVIDVSPKLKTRLTKGLEALMEGHAEVKKLIATRTFDEMQMDKLKRQFDNMAPSLAKIRGGALDVGFYWSLDVMGSACFCMQSMCQAASADT